MVNLVWHSAVVLGTCGLLLLSAGSSLSQDRGPGDFVNHGNPVNSGNFTNVSGATGNAAGSSSSASPLLGLEAG